MTTVTTTEAQRSLDELCRNLLGVLNKQSGLSQTQREDFLVLLSLQFKLQPSELGLMGTQMLHRFEERAGLDAVETPEALCAAIARYFEEHPIPSTLVSGLREVVQTFIQSAQSRDALAAAKRLLGRSEFSQPVTGQVTSANSLFSMMLASKRS